VLFMARSTKYLIAVTSHPRDPRILAGMHSWHRRPGRHEADHPAATEKGLAGAGYDAQADLGLPTGRPAVEASDVVLIGMDTFVEPPPEPGYDIGRDTAS
jgi:hypothetical protein